MISLHLSSGMQVAKLSNDKHQLYGFHNISTHLPLDKIAAISQTTFSGAFWCIKSLVFWFELLKFDPKDLIENKSILVPEPLLPSSLTYISDTRGKWVKNTFEMNHSHISLKQKLKSNITTCMIKKESPFLYLDCPIFVYIYSWKNVVYIRG